MFSLHARSAARAAAPRPTGRAGAPTPRRAPPPARASGDSVDDAIAAAEALLAAASGGSAAPRGGAAAASTSDAALPDGVELRCDVNGCSIVALDHDAASPAGPGGSLMASLSSVDEDGNPALGARRGDGASAAAAAAVPADFELAEGPGWRLGVDRAAPPGGEGYAAVVGGDGWSAALTRDEYDDLTRLLANLRESVATLHVCGDWDGASEDAALEMSTPRVWVQGRAPAERLGSLQAAWGKGDGGAAGAAGSSPPAPAAAFELRFILLQAREFEGVWPAEAVAGVLAHIDGTASPAAAAAAAAAASRGGVAANA